LTLTLCSSPSLSRFTTGKKTPLQHIEVTQKLPARFFVSAKGKEEGSTAKYHTGVCLIVQNASNKETLEVVDAGNGSGRIKCMKCD